MRRLPLFPLPAVLFPGALLPLHVFEPRYRRMMAYCLEGDRRFGVVYHDPDRAGPYEVEPGQVGCVAEILRSIALFHRVLEEVLNHDGPLPPFNPRAETYGRRPDSDSE